MFTKSLQEACERLAELHANKARQGLSQAFPGLRQP